MGNTYYESSRRRITRTAQYQKVQSTVYMIASHRYCGYIRTDHSAYVTQTGYLWYYWDARTSFPGEKRM